MYGTLRRPKHKQEWCEHLGGPATTSRVRACEGVITSKCMYVFVHVVVEAAIRKCHSC